MFFQLTETGATLVSGAMLALGLSVILVMARRWFKRRAAFQEFAARHQLRFVGVLPSDKRGPFIHFEHVRWAVLLYHVVEGRWEEFEAAVFDYRASRNVTWTAVILTLPADITPIRIDPASAFHLARSSSGRVFGGWDRVTPSHPSLAATTVMTAENPESAEIALGPQSSAVLASRQNVTIESHFSYLRVTLRRQIDPGEVEDLLRFATQLARALLADARSSVR